MRWDKTPLRALTFFVKNVFLGWPYVGEAVLSGRGYLEWQEVFCKWERVFLFGEDIWDRNSSAKTEMS